MKKGKLHIRGGLSKRQSLTRGIIGPAKGSLLAAIFALSLFGLFMQPTDAVTTVPTKMNFQGRLTDNAGVPMADGLYNMKFRLFTVSTAGSDVWNETRETTNRVQVTNGLFSVQLGDVTPIPATLFASGSLYFEIELPTPATATCNTASCGNFSEGPMSPRHPLAASAYAMNAETLDGLDSSAFAAASGSANYLQNGTSPQTADFNITGTGTAASLQAATLDTASAGTLTIGGANATSITLADNTVLDANMSLTVVGGATGTRPSSPTEGMIYFDTTTKQLITYSNGKWQADSKTAQFMVAANDSSQATKDGAQYVANGEDSSGSGIGTVDGDQVQINQALTAAAAAGGGTVFLSQGTFTIDGSISVPNNVTLAGSGSSTVVRLGNFGSATVHTQMVINTDTTAGTGIVVRDLLLDGRSSINTSGAPGAVSLTNMGDSATGRLGATLQDITIQNLGYTAVMLDSSDNNNLHNIVGKNNDYGIDFSNSSSSNRVSNSSFSDGLAGIMLNTGSGNTITASMFANNADYGIYSSASNNILSDNTITGSDLGIWLYYADNHQVSGNYVTGSASSGIAVSSGVANTVSLNKVVNSGGATANEGISLSAADNNSVIDNTISDTSCTTTCYAVNVSAGTSNYLSGNVFTTTAGTAIINDAGTGTRLAGQPMTQGGLDQFFKQTNTTSAFQIQNATGVAQFTADTTNSRIQIGSSTTDATAIVFALDNYNQATDPTGVNGAMYYNTSLNKFRCYQNGAWTDCVTSASGGANTSLSNLASTNINTALNTTAGNLTLQTTTSGNIVLNAAGTTELQDDTNVGGNLTVAAGKSLTLAGGNTASRPASPSEGMLYYDSEIKQLLVYANGKWQADRSTSTKVVGTSATDAGTGAAASINPAGADYVNTSTTSAHTTINSAITALGSAGGTVYLMEGTYIIDGTINVSTKVKISGAGPGTVIKLKNAINAALDAFTLSATAHEASIENITIDGNKANNTAGTQRGILIGANGTATQSGSTVAGVTASNFRTSGVYIGGGQSHKVIDSSFFSNTTNGVHVASGTDTTVTANVLSSNGIGVELYGSNSTVSNNTMRANGKGIYVQGGARNTMTGNIITASTTNVNGAAIDLWAAGDHNVVSSNTLTGGAQYGVSVRQASGNTTVIGNVIEGNAGHGVLVNGSPSVMITNNRIHNNGGTGANHGIHVAATSATPNITSNTITDTAGTGYAINIDSTTTDAYLSENVYSGTGSTSINDASTTTRYANQINSSGQLINSATGGLATKLVSGSSNDLFQAQNSSGTALMKVTSTGALQAASFDTTTTTTLTIGVANATSIALNQNTTVASGKTFTSEGATTVKLTSATAFQVQNAGGTALFAVDTSGSTVTVGSSTNGIVMSANGLVFSGTARPTRTITFTPEYSGATFTGDGGGDNVGTLTSDFCSGSSRQNINASACGLTDTRNYYQWANTQATAQDYDIYIRYQIPSDYSSGSMSNLTLFGWGTTTATESATVQLYSDASGTACSTSGNAVTSNAAWTSATVASPLGACTVSAGDTVTFKVRLVAGQNNSVRASAISFGYRQAF